MTHVISISMKTPPTWHRNSTAVTFDPRRLHTDPYNSESRAMSLRLHPSLPLSLHPFLPSPSIATSLPVSLPPFPPSVPPSSPLLPPSSPSLPPLLPSLPPSLPLTPSLPPPPYSLPPSRPPSLLSPSS